MCIRDRNHLRELWEENNSLKKGQVNHILSEPVGKGFVDSTSSNINHFKEILEKLSSNVEEESVELKELEK